MLVLVFLPSRHTNFEKNCRSLKTTEIPQTQPLQDQPECIRSSVCSAPPSLMSDLSDLTEIPNKPQYQDRATCSVQQAGRRRWVQLAGISSRAASCRIVTIASDNLLAEIRSSEQSPSPRSHALKEGSNFLAVENLQCEQENLYTCCTFAA